MRHGELLAPANSPSRDKTLDLKSLATHEPVARSSADGTTSGTNDDSRPLYDDILFVSCRPPLAMLRIVRARMLRSAHPDRVLVVVLTLCLSEI